MAVLNITDAASQAACDAIVDLIDAGAGAGTIKIYDGTIPTTADTAVGAQNLLGTLTFSDPAFGATAATGIATASAITGDSSADATGTASWARIADSNGTTIFDCDVTATAGGGTIELNSVSITAGGTIDITNFATITMPQS